MSHPLSHPPVPSPLATLESELARVHLQLSAICALLELWRDGRRSAEQERWLQSTARNVTSALEDLLGAQYDAASLVEAFESGPRR
jgi:hypothetical protein